MIISASRRTDIPAFYSEWFMNRLNDGYVYVRNPFNYNQISSINLSPELIETIVFWTKNPLDILKHLGQVESLGYFYYFQFTLTPYGRDIERNVPEKSRMLGIFKELSDEIGKDKVIWRYDPIFISDQASHEFHVNSFKHLASELEGYTEKCVISFLDRYKKCERNMKPIKLIDERPSLRVELSKVLKKIADENNIMLATCAEEIELEDIGIPHGKCIDDKLISRIVGIDIEVKKDTSQRDACGCVKSVDIGVYNTCKHNCLYCYANYSLDAVDRNKEKHDPRSPLLIGAPTGKEKIIDRKIETYRKKQLSLF